MFIPITPRVVFYNKACSTVKAALLRLHCVLLSCYIIKDKFHLKDCQCNSLNVADRYRCLDNLETSVTEAMNARIKISLYYMRFISRNVLVKYFKF